MAAARIERKRRPRDAIEIALGGAIPSFKLSRKSRASIQGMLSLHSHTGVAAKAIVLLVVHASSRDRWTSRVPRSRSHQVSNLLNPPWAFAYELRCPGADGCMLDGQGTRRRQN